MLRDLRRSLIAVAAATALLGGLYPLAIAAVAQPLFGERADGEARLLAAPRTVGDAPDPAAFLPRPSQTDYSATATAFSNLGPNGADTAAAIRANRDAYAEREGIHAERVPADAAQASASGLDPDVSPANARIQARRVARERGLALGAVLRVVRDVERGRLLGIVGEPTVNVADLNAAVDAVAR